jgi:hypothetical protein
MRRRTRLLVPLAALAALAVTATPAQAEPAGLEPGAFRVLAKRVPINVVLIGYDKRPPVDAIRRELADSYTPVVRAPRGYGLPGRNLGLRYRYDYRFVHAPAGFESRFFSYLAASGRRGPRTVFQSAYNDMERNVLEVPERILYLDGPSVERWLEDRADRLGIGRRSYTVYLINWYGRPGFRFHLYERTGRLEPDTGVDFGTFDEFKLIAWGGTSGRSWFLDLSAGPEGGFASTANFDVDHPDLDGDGGVDYRLPPIWEYRQGGFRQPSELGHDLGLVVRYVAADLLFTTSPLFDPLVTTPGLGGSKVADITLFQADPAVDGRRWIDREAVLRELSSFQPYHRWKVRLRGRVPDAGARHAFDVWLGRVDDPDACWHRFGSTFAQLFCYFQGHRDRYVPSYPAEDYVGAVFAWNTTDEGGPGGLLGYADDNWKNGRQTLVFAFDSPGVRDDGFGFTDTTVHEFGHHLGMSHPQDGYDSASATDFGPDGSFLFAWLGGRSDTVMHYLGLAGGFSRFDRDNMYRWEAAGFLNAANRLAGRVVDDPDVDSVAGLLEEADRLAMRAQSAFAAWRYGRSVASALGAYDAVRRAARELGIPTPLPARDAAPPRRPAGELHPTYPIIHPSGR